MSNLQTHYHFKLDFRKVNKHIDNNQTLCRHSFNAGDYDIHINITYTMHSFVP